jgi:regulator of sigma E protease
MLGGIIVNVILAILIFIMILWVWGKEYMPPSNAKYGVATDSLARTIGLKDGDIVLKVDTFTLKNLYALRGEIVLKEAQSLTVKRGDSIINIKLQEDLIKKLNSRKAGNLIDIRMPLIIDSFEKNSTADKAGIEIGDQIVGINDRETPYYHEIKDAIKDKKNAAIKLKLLRGSDTIVKDYTLNKDALFGVSIRTPKELGFKFEKERFNFLQAIPAGFKECWSTLGNYITGLRQLFTGKAKASESVGSVFSIGSIYPGEWDWLRFWTLTAIFSIILAFMNILPIPGLDGGHALFTLAEMITGRKPSDKFLEYAQMVGMVLLLALMAYALGLDIWRIFK